MQQEDNRLFEILLKDLVSTMKLHYPGINPDIRDWKGQEITDFQEEIRLKVKANISEKWFYTHIKGDHQRLPRIDMLNMLAKFAGYENWDDFRHKNHRETSGHAEVKKGGKVFILVPALVLVIVLVFYGFFRYFNSREYEFTFFDAETMQPIVNTSIQVNLLGYNESPVTFFSDSGGKVRIVSDESMVRMVIRSPYFLTDTVIRMLKKFHTTERIGLHANEYAMMLDFFSRMDVNGWQKRQQQLDSIIADDAMIYRVHGEKQASGLELLTKQEFMDFMAIPTHSLKNMKILEVRNSENKIKIIRYQIEEN